MKKKPIQPGVLAKYIARYLDNKKAQDVTVRNLRDISDIADFFVFATATSTTHVAALADHLKKELEKEGIVSFHREGYNREMRWIVVDYVTVIVHVFTEDVRDYYQIENFWSDAKKVLWKEKKSDKK